MATHPIAGVSAAILAGGLGTRLRSVVADRPKVLASVCGRPFLTYLLDQLAQAGFRDVVLLVGYAADQIQDTFGTQYQGMRLTYSREPEPLGTGGAVRFALPLLQEPDVVLLNGDSYCDFEFPTLLNLHRQARGAATLTLAEVPDVSRYGAVRVTADGRITQFEEKSAVTGPGFINAGVYLFARDRLHDIPPGRAVSLERETLPAWVAERRVFGFRGGRFIDIGTPDSYREAEQFFATLPVPEISTRD